MNNSSSKGRYAVKMTEIQLQVKDNVIKTGDIPLSYGTIKVPCWVVNSTTVLISFFKNAPLNFIILHIICNDRSLGAFLISYMTKVLVKITIVKAVILH